MRKQKNKAKLRILSSVLFLLGIIFDVCIYDKLSFLVVYFYEYMIKIETKK